MAVNCTVAFLLARPVHEMHIHLPTYTSLQWCIDLSPPLALKGILAKSLEAEQLSKRVLTYTALSEAATWGAYSTPRVSFKSRTNSGIGLILHYPSFLSHLSFPQELNPASFVSFAENRHILVQKMGFIKPILSMAYTFTTCTDSKLNTYATSDKSCPQHHPWHIPSFLPLLNCAFHQGSFCHNTTKTPRHASCISLTFSRCQLKKNTTNSAAHLSLQDGWSVHSLIAQTDRPSEQQQTYKTTGLIRKKAEMWWITQELDGTYSSGLSEA